MPLAKRQRSDSGRGVVDINNQIRDVIKSQVDGLRRELEANIRGKTDHIEKLEKQVEKETNILWSNLNSKDEKISLLRKELEAKNSQIKGLMSSIEILELREKNSPLQKELESKNSEIRGLKSSIELLKIRESNSPLKKELEFKTSEINHLKNDILLIAKRDSFLKSILVREMKRVKILEKEMEILEKEIEILKDNNVINKDIEDELESLMKDTVVGKTTEIMNQGNPNRDDNITEKEEDMAYISQEEGEDNVSEKSESSFEEGNISEENVVTTEEDNETIIEEEEASDREDEDNITDENVDKEYLQDNETITGEDNDEEYLIKSDKQNELSKGYQPRDNTHEQNDEDDRISDFDENSQDNIADHTVSQANIHALLEDGSDEEPSSLNENIPIPESNGGSSNIRIKDEHIEMVEETIAVEAALSLQTLETREQTQTPTQLLLKETSLDQLLSNVESFLF